VFPAHSEGDDIVVAGSRWPMLRQQTERSEGKPARSLADFLSPSEDSLGLFAVSAGFGCEEAARAYEADHDDYHAIMVRALADRLAEAGAEWVHRELRVGWGLESRDSFSPEQLIKEHYSGIRPAPGYPACPDHVTKKDLWKILGVQERIGMKLLDSGAMWPAASVSGMVFHHPEARYFAINRIGNDQLADYAQRLGESSETVARRLATLLS
jgi:5-methyltetrahydrofolate--homocysteine methyltransferase